MFPKETKILVVDDMVSMRMIVKKTLKELGFTNLTDADDGDTAWDLVQKAVAENAPFQLIVSDWNMPRMKGIEFLKKVRGLAATAKTPFVLLTAEAEASQITEAGTWGVSGYILKPFTAATLTERLGGVWRTHSKG